MAFIELDEEELEEMMDIASNARLLLYSAQKRITGELHRLVELLRILEFRLRYSGGVDDED